MSSNAELIDEIIDKILSGNRDTTAANLREVLIDMIGSYQNLDEKGAPNGYVPLNSNAKIDASLLAIASPKLYQFLRDDGSFASPDAVFQSSAGSAVLAERYNFFEFFGTTSTWTFVAKKNNRIYWVINRGSGNLVVNTSGGGSDFQPLTGGSAVNTLTVAAGTCVVFVDDGDRFIVIPQGGGGSTYTGTAGETTVLGTVIGLDTPLATSKTVAKITGTTSGSGKSVVIGTSNVGEISDDPNVTIGASFLNIMKSVNGNSGLNISNANAGSAANAFVNLENNSGQGGQFFKSSTTQSVYKIFGPNSFGIYTDSGNLGFLNDSAIGKIIFAAGASSTAQVTLLANGNLTYINQYSVSGIPSISAGAAAGTSPTISIVGTNKCGKITLTQGSGAAPPGTICTVTFSGSFTAPNGSVVVLGKEAAIAGITLSTTSNTTGFTIEAGLVALLTPGVTYVIPYVTESN